MRWCYLAQKWQLAGQKPRSMVAIGAIGVATWAEWQWRREEDGEEVNSAREQLPKNSRRLGGTAFLAERESCSQDFGEVSMLLVWDGQGGVPRGAVQKTQALLPLAAGESCQATIPTLSNHQGLPRHYISSVIAFQEKTSVSCLALDHRKHRCYATHRYHHYHHHHHCAYLGPFDNRVAWHGYIPEMNCAVSIGKAVLTTAQRRHGHGKARQSLPYHRTDIGKAFRNNPTAKRLSSLA